MTTLYGVSSGNGNDGVSHLYPDYYCRTDNPWLLAKAALLGEFKAGKGQAFALEHGDIDGDSEYTISAVIDAPPCEDTDNGEYPAAYVCSECDHEQDSIDDATACDECGTVGRWQEKEFDDYEDGRNWADSNGAWLIVEVFPVDEPESEPGQYDTPIYATLDDCFDAATLKLARESEK